MVIARGGTRRQTDVLRTRTLKARPDRSHLATSFGERYKETKKNMSMANEHGAAG